MTSVCEAYVPLILLNVAVLCQFSVILFVTFFQGASGGIKYRIFQFLKYKRHALYFLKKIAKALRFNTAIPSSVPIRIVQYRLCSFFVVQACH